MTTAIERLTDSASPVAPVLAGLQSGHTVRAYKRHLENFLSWYTLQDAPGLSKAVVSAYKAELIAEGRGPASINQALSAIRKMATEAADNGHLDASTAQAIKRVGSIRSETLPAGRSISGGELSAMLATCQTNAAGIRDAAIIGLLYLTGMRRGELAALDLADYDADSGELRILHGKGNKQRTAPIENGAAAALGDWLTIRGDWPGPLFCPVFRSGRIKHTRLTTQAIYHILVKRARLAHLTRPLSPHDLRRTVIGDLLDAGADIATVQKLVGHANVTTTARYDRRGDAAKRRAIKLLHVPYTSRFIQKEQG